MPRKTAAADGRIRASRARTVLHISQHRTTAVVSPRSASDTVRVRAVSTLLGWLRRPFDRCRYGHTMWTKDSYDLCRKHGQ
jgi:hypothetical protein